MAFWLFAVCIFSSQFNSYLEIFLLNDLNFLLLFRSDALNTVLLRLEGLQDSSMKSEVRTPRDHRSSPSQRRNKIDTPIINDEHKVNGERNEINNLNKSVNSSETTLNSSTLQKILS